MDKNFLKASQVAELLGKGWSRQKVHVYLSRGKFPEPITYIGEQPLWKKSQFNLKGENKMWSDISDKTIKEVMNKIESGIINPETREFVFQLANGRNMAVHEITEDRARYVLETYNHEITDLVDVSFPTFNGMTYKEVIKEAEKRGIK